MRVLEKDIQEAIITYLRIKHFIVLKYHSTMFTNRGGQLTPLSINQQGISDIIACAPNGKFWAIEVKRPGGKLTDKQTEFLNSVDALGGVAFVAYSIDDVIQRV